MTIGDTVIVEVIGTAPGHRAHGGGEVLSRNHEGRSAGTAPPRVADHLYIESKRPGSERGAATDDRAVRVNETVIRDDERILAHVARQQAEIGNPVGKGEPEIIGGGGGVRKGLGVVTGIIGRLGRRPTGITTHSAEPQLDIVGDRRDIVVNCRPTTAGSAVIAPHLHLVLVASPGDQIVSKAVIGADHKHIFTEGQRGRGRNRPGAAVFHSNGQGFRVIVSQVKVNFSLVAATGLKLVAAQTGISAPGGENSRRIPRTTREPPGTMAARSTRLPTRGKRSLRRPQSTAPASVRT